MKFVVVDDDEIELSLYSRHIMKNNDEVTPLSDADTAKAYLTNPDNKFDKLICDGLFWGWKSVFTELVKRGEQNKMVLFTTYEDMRMEGAQLGIKVVDKSETKIQDLLAELSPRGGGIEGQQQ